MTQWIPWVSLVAAVIEEDNIKKELPMNLKQ